MIVPERLTPRRAVDTLRSIRSNSKALFLPDDSTLAEPGIDLAGLSGYRQLADFHLLNLAAKHAAALVTFDRRLPGALVGQDRNRVRLLG